MDGYPIPGSIQGRGGGGFEKLDLGEGVPPHGTGKAVNTGNNLVCKKK